MTTHLYEVALFGDFYAKDLSQVLNRFTQISESAHTIHVHEIVFEPISAEPDPASELVLLRCRKHKQDQNTWELYTYLKPESARVHPEATVRSAVYCQLSGDAIGFASALGYRKRHQYYKRGYLFRRGILDIQMFQEERVDQKTETAVRAEVEALWEVEVKSSSPTRNTQETPLSQVIDAILQVQQTMRGLLDLRRKDV